MCFLSAVNRCFLGLEKGGVCLSTARGRKSVYAAGCLQALPVNSQLVIAGKDTYKRCHG